MRRTPTFNCREHAIVQGEIRFSRNSRKYFETKICLSVGTGLGVCSES